MSSKIDMAKCFAGKQTVTADEFASLPAAAKGYVVYMLGCRNDQPSVPEDYTPNADEQIDYAGGQMQAVIEAQDSP